MEMYLSSRSHFYIFFVTASSENLWSITGYHFDPIILALFSLGAHNGLQLAFKYVNMISSFCLILWSQIFFSFLFSSHFAQRFRSWSFCVFLSQNTVSHSWLTCFDPLCVEYLSWMNFIICFIISADCSLVGTIIPVSQAGATAH